MLDMLNRRADNAMEARGMEALAPALKNMPKLMELSLSGMVVVYF
jgi:hypothetical protein